MLNEIIYRPATEKDLKSIGNIFKENTGKHGVIYALHVIEESKKDPESVCVAEQQIDKDHRTVIGFARHFTLGKKSKQAYCTLDLATDLQEEVLLQMRMETKQVVEKVSKIKKIDAPLDKALSVLLSQARAEKARQNKEYRNQ